MGYDDTAGVVDRIRQRLDQRNFAAWERLGTVADHLGNTPAVTRRSYIHAAVPALVDRQEEWRAAVRKPGATWWLGPADRSLLGHWRDGPSAHEFLAAA